MFKEIWLCPKIMVLPSGTSSQTPDLENFAMASRLRCQQNSSSSTVEFVDDTRMTSSGCLLQVGSLQSSITSTCCGFLVGYNVPTSCFYNWQDFDSMLRGPSVVAKFLVFVNSCQSYCSFHS